MITTDPHLLVTHQLAQFNRQAGIGLLISVANATVLVAVLWSVSEHAFLLAWLTAVIVTSALRLWYARTHSDPERNTLTSGYWSGPLLHMTVLVGLTWGVAALLLFPHDAVPQQIFLILMIGATAAGVLPMYIALPSVYATYLACIFTPLTVTLIRADEEAYRTMAAMLPILAGSLWVTARSMHAGLMESLGLHFNFQNLASLDGLTQIPNRRHFDAALTKEWNRAARVGLPLSVILVDVDKFKAYNDTYGHQAGDACLQRVARALSDTVQRAGDLVARYGGEEFVLLLSQTTRDEGVALAERLRASVERLAIEHSGAEGKVVTISVGGATTIPRPNQAEMVLLRTADEALYRAKETGRNRVIWGMPEP